MAWSLDARIPLAMVPDEEALAASLADDRLTAVLAEAPPPPRGRAVAVVSFDLSAHPGGCACCGGRSTAAAALDRLFQARVRGACGWFDRVVALADSDAARGEITAALRDDPVTAARFRLG